ncbi:hypothetical protein EGR_00607 [Echinococcus granulosus]|uniref:Hyccin n=1 Tax=Echinococcus granulosus TaxID=6210 RepID=W6V163_ECHGR|nr:hypothetical protein EGR_00607 [Echinococcus granulosus]EUB64657.1 hypothetical protein EGR_00607 [Echinococcus granulosus]
MTSLEQNVQSKIQYLFQWLKNPFQPRQEIREGSKLMYDVQVVEGIVKIFKDLASPEEIHIICHTLYDAYLSGDKKSRLFVTLLLPTMLLTYLVHLHTDAGTASAGSTGVKPSSPTQSHRNSQATFSLDDMSVPTGPLESLAFLLSEFCQLAPAFIRCPEYCGSGVANLPDYGVASVYHSPPFSIATKSQTPKTITTSSSVATLRFNYATSTGTLPPPTFPNPDPACIVRIYADILTRQFVEGTDQQQGIVIFSIRTFCDLVERLTALNTHRILSCSQHHHSVLLIDLSIAIDKLLFMLSFELSQPADPNAGSASPSDDMEALRDRLFEELLPRLERYASYHCFASVLLVVGAIRNAWLLRLHPSTTVSLAAMAPLYRRIRLTSDETVDLSDALSDEAMNGVLSPTSVSTHRPSVFTNANFRAEPVAEDIPISGEQEAATTATDRWRKLYQNHNLTLGSHNHVRHHHHYQQLRQQQYFEEGLTRSSENLHFTLSSSSLSLDKDGQNHRRDFDVVVDLAIVIIVILDDYSASVTD